MFKFFGRGKADRTFIKGLVETLVREVPPGLMVANRKVMSVNKITRMLERTYRAAAEYQRAQGLGMMRRAVLANDFKWELKNAGYPDEFIDVATEGLVVELSRVAKVSPSPTGKG